MNTETEQLSGHQFPSDTQDLNNSYLSNSNYSNDQTATTFSAVTEKGVNEDAAADPADAAQASGVLLVSATRARCNLVISFLRKQYFVFIILLSICLAYVYPSLGSKASPLPVSIIVKVLVAVIFFVMGISMETKDLKKSLLSWRLNLAIQLSGLIVFPAFMYAFCFFLNLIPDDIWPQSLSVGLIILAALPTTMSTNAILTKASGGNAELSVINAVIGNSVGVFVTPLTLTLMLSAPGNASLSSLSSVFVALGLIVLLPLVIGNLLLNFGPRRILAQLPLGKFDVANKVILAIIVYTVMSDTFISNVSITATNLIILICILCFISLFVGSSVLIIAFLLKVSRRDRIACFFCILQKTLGVGVPLISVMFEGSNAGIYALPLVIYHPLQLIVGSLLVTVFLNWLVRNDTDFHRIAGESET